MLRLMREKAGNWFIKFLLGAIVIVFVFWGVGSFRERSGGRVATVNGEVITAEEYRKAYNDLVEQLRQNFGDTLNEDMIKVLQVKKQALDRIIDNKLLLAEANLLNFRVSKKELANAIRNIDAFQSAGVFNSRQYKNILNINRLTPEEFEAIQREAMMVAKLRSFVTDGIKVSDQEIREWYIWSNTSTSINFVLFDPDTYEDISVTPEEIQTYFDENRSSYKTDPLIKVRYLYFNPEVYAAGVEIGDDEIKTYYEEHPEEFETEETVEARHILRTVGQGATPQADEEARKKALEIMETAKTGEDFAELAKRFSQGPTKDNGGYLGTFERGKMVKPFSDKAFSMSPGEISDPVRTPFGWHIIKVEKVNKGRTRSFEEAEPEIREKLTQNRARNLAYDEAEAVYDASFEGDDLLISAEARKLEVLTTDFFSKEGPDKGVNNRVKFAEAAFALLPMEISDVLDFGDGYYILQVIERIPEKIPGLEKVKTRVKADLLKERQRDRAEKDAEEMLSALKTGTPMKTAAKKYDLEPTASDFLKRNDLSPKVGFGRAVAEASFNLSKKNPLPKGVIAGEKGFYVIQLKERKKPDLNKLDEQQAQIKAMLLQQKRAAAFNEFLDELRNKSEISIEEGVLD